MGGADWLRLPASLAGFPPLAVALFASRMEPLVSDGIDEFEISDPVVLLVFVLVMDLEPFRDRPVVRFPFNDVGESHSSLARIVDSVIPLFGDEAVSGWVLAWRSALSHASQSQNCLGSSSPASRSLRAAFGQA